MERPERRAFLIVLDGVGIGALPDAADWGDEGANTFLHVAERCGPLRMPHMAGLGLGNIMPAPGVDAVEAPGAAFGRMREIAAGKDTTVGHWEIAGVVQAEPFPTFPEGFPRELIEAFEAKVGRSVLGNRAASGTAIIDELGEEHVRTGSPIVYTSADSVFQIAAHEEVIPLDDLYRMCESARELLTGPLALARVIARPFLGAAGSFERTKNRRDYSLAPPGPTAFEALAGAGLAVRGIGKISDIYAGRGITESVKTGGNGEGVERLLEAMAGLPSGAAFVNLNDFDTLWGHRNDPESFARGLEEFDRAVPEILSARREEDLLIVTADHGNDPTAPGTDHTREHVPLLALGPDVPPGRPLGTRRTFADVAATLARHFAVPFSSPGRPLQAG